MDGTEPPALERLFAEAQRTTTMQADRAAATDDKASQLLRFNAVLLGILIGVISLATERAGLFGLPPSGPMAVLFIAGFAGLAASTLLAVLSFRATDVRAGLRGEDLHDALDHDLTEETFLREGVRAYVLGIIGNSRSLRRAALRLHLALYCLVTTILAYAVAATILLIRSVPS